MTGPYWTKNTTICHYHVQRFMLVRVAFVHSVIQSDPETGKIKKQVRIWLICSLSVSTHDWKKMFVFPSSFKGKFLEIKKQSTRYISVVLVYFFPMGFTQSQRTAQLFRHSACPLALAQRQFSNKESIIQEKQPEPWLALCFWSEPRIKSQTSNLKTNIFSIFWLWILNWISNEWVIHGLLLLLLSNFCLLQLNYRLSDDIQTKQTAVVNLKLFRSSHFKCQSFQPVTWNDLRK